MVVGTNMLWNDRFALGGLGEYLTMAGGCPLMVDAWMLEVNMRAAELGSTTHERAVRHLAISRIPFWNETQFPT
jgi:hypothetical protein